MANDTLNRIDKYLVLGSLGHGAKSTIWKVQDPQDGKIYTLKRVIRETDDDDRFLEQVRSEFMVCNRIESPYLRKAYELRKVRSWFKVQELLLLLEYVEGKTLKQARPSDIFEIIRVFTLVSRGVDVLHRNGFVHADIKPKNILVVENGDIKIIDFGQSCPIGHRKERIQGTPDYMAPEQVKRAPLDQRTDVFNLGASMYWVLTGQTFPTTMSRESKEIAVPNPGAAPRPDEVNSDVPPALSNLVMACCSKSRSARPDNMGEVIARLDVARHLVERKQQPEKDRQSESQASARESREKTDKFKPVSADDTGEFERFLEDEDIL